INHMYNPAKIKIFNKPLLFICRSNTETHLQVNVISSLPDCKIHLICMPLLPWQRALPVFCSWCELHSGPAIHEQKPALLLNLSIK
uniref:Uncharacterized protein n=1 Tax=Podarcis muralis TaxID=64176 RepID=A0A670IH95_PODMU